MMSLTEEERCNVRMKNAEGSKRQYKLFLSAHLNGCKMKKFFMLLCDGGHQGFRVDTLTPLASPRIHSPSLLPHYFSYKLFVTTQKFKHS